MDRFFGERTGLFFECSGIDDDGEKLGGQFSEIFRSVKGFGIEEKRVSGTHRVDPAAVAVADFALKHIDEFHARMVKHRERFGLIGKGNEIRLDGSALADGVAEEFVLMPGPASAALDLEPLSGSNESGVSLLFELPEKGRNGDLKGD